MTDNNTCSPRNIDMLLMELNASRMINEQITRLNSASDLKSAIQDVLAAVGNYMNAERAYIFQVTDGLYSNTMEWCAPGIRPEIDTLQNIPQEDITWVAPLNEGKNIIIPDIQDIRTSDPFMYDLLSRQNITSVIEAPITVNGVLAGFIGVDNAPSDITSIIADSLMLLGSFIGVVIHNRREHERVVKNHADMKDSRDMQKEMIGSISCGVLAYTLPEHKLLAVNDAAKKIFGCTHDEEALDAFASFLKEKVIPQDRDRVIHAEHRPKNIGDITRLSYRAYRGDRIIDVESTIKLLRFANGQNYILCSLLDVTEQKHLTNSLARERKSYRDALANGSEFSFFFDVTEGLLHEEFVTAHGVNLVRDLGFTLPVSFDELLARYMQGAALEFADESMKELFTCKGLIKNFENGTTNAVVEYYTPDTGIHIRVNGLMSRDDETGHIHAAVVASDITELRRKEREQQNALRAANEKLAFLNDEINIRIDTILDGISGGLKIFDANNDLRCTYISEGAAALQGYSVDEFFEAFEKNPTGNILPEEKDPVIDEIRRQTAETGRYSVKYRVPHKDGSIRWVIDRGKLVADSVTGKNVYYTVLQDVTELEERNHQISNMLSLQEKMAESLGSGILAYTLPDREILLINQEAKRMLSSIGSTSDFSENGGLDIMTRLSPEDAKNVSDAVRSLKKPGDQAEYIFHSSSAQDRLTYKANTKMLSLEDGKLMVLSSITDITRQELMERRLEAERRQYRNALAYGSEVIFTMDLTDGWLRNDVIFAGGLNMSENIGITVPSSYDDLAAKWFSDDRIVTDSPYLDLVRSRDKMIAACESGTSIIELEYFIPDSGKYYRILILLYRINGHIQVSFAIYDVTSSRQEKREHQSVIESLGRIYSALYLFSFRENSYIAFKQNEDIAGELAEKGTYEKFLDVYINKFVQPGYEEKIRAFLDPENIRAALAGKDHVTVEFRRKNFGWCRITLVASERGEDGGVVSVVFAGNVIEEQKQADLAQQEALRAACESANIANSAKTDFLANMSHDIRTPMNAIIGLTAIAGTHIDDKERVIDCLSKITISSRHLLGIINEVLDMSKIESGKMELQEDEFSLPELIDNLLTMSKPEVSAKKHELVVSIKNIDHEQVIGDSQRIQQVFMNLMSNAVKYTPVGGKIGLSITEKPTNKPKVGCYEFIFEDNGIGMSEEYLEHIFEPFTRNRSDARVEKIQGTGLGMPITRNIVQMMNGDIKVESQLDKGTRITVTFFLKLPAEDEKIAHERLIDLPVLVADDDESSCVYTCDILHEIGMKGEWVLTGQEAVDVTAAHHDAGDDFFAVILDWKMPGMDGIETTKEIRKRVGKDVPIIIISAYDWSDIELEARAAGANAFISKPLFKSRMVHLLSELAGGIENEKKASDLDIFADENFTGKRALLVEDNFLNAEIAEEILSMTGLEVEFARDGKEAVDIMTAVEDNYFDVIFMDIQMPVMNGYEAARAIRTLPGNYAKSVPIIAMTANAFAEDVAAAKNAGMNEHIAKPLDFAQLSKALKKWL